METSFVCVKCTTSEKLEGRDMINEIVEYIYTPKFTGLNSKE